MNNKWTPEQISTLNSLRQAGKTTPQIAKALGRSVKAVEQACFRHQVAAAEQVANAPTTVEQDLQEKNESYWKGRFNDLSNKYDRLLTKNALTDRLIDQVLAMAPVSYSPAPAIIRDKRVREGKPQSAVLMLSDQHIGAVVSPAQTLTYGRYDFPMFMARQKLLEESTISITTKHVNTAVPELVIALLGDCLDGALSHSNEVGQLNPMFNQFFLGAHVTAQFLRNVAQHFPSVRIYNTVGNHPRFQNQKKMPTKNRHSNFDQFFYALARELVRGIPNIKWELNQQPFQTFDVNGFQFFAGHGDTLRGGDKALGVPNHAVGRTVSTTSQLFTKFGNKAPNYYLFGHLHRSISLPHATGDVIINGGFVGLDGFGLAEMFTPADPMQKLFFVHPTYGKTATYDIALKFAEVKKDSPYILPEGFELV